MPTTNLLKEFDAVRTKTWHDAIEKYLKGKKVHSLDWELEEGLMISPLQRKADTEGHLLASIQPNKSNAWRICEKIKVKNYKEANQKALLALTKGANALSFVLENTPTLSELDILLDNILLDLVSIHFEGAVDENTIKIIAQLKNSNQLSGSIASDSPIEWIDTIDRNHFFSFQYITIKLKDNKSSSLAEAIYQASYCIDRLLKKGFEKEQLSSFFRFEFEMQEDFFVEIAKFRAFQRLWLGLLEAYEIEQPQYPAIHAITSLSRAKTDQYWNMITTTTQAMAAAIGGVSSMEICPSNGLDNADDFSERIARNVQHLLMLESYLDRVIDPAAGSYYIENITEKLTTSAWSKFCKIIPI